MATDDAPGLYGPEGSLARLTRADNGIHDIAEKLRAQALPIRAKVVRDALQAVAANARERGEFSVSVGFGMAAELGDDEALALLGRLLK